MIEVREATLEDIEPIREIFLATYGDSYAYPQYYDLQVLAKLVYADGTVLLVAVDSETKRVIGTASVVFSVGAYNDLVGEFGRLAVHPDFRGRGVGNLLMEGRIERVRSRIHVGLVENRVAHQFSQKISKAFDFVPVGFIPQKLLLKRRESVANYVRFFGDALCLRRNNPRVIPEASQLAGLAQDNCGLPFDAIIDDTSAPYPHENDFELGELKTEGYTSLLRIERGRLRHRDVFGPIRLHYGLFQLRAAHSHYLLARREDQIAGGIGFMVDDVEKAVRVFELISLSDEPIRYLLEQLVMKCERELDVEFIEVDVSAYSPSIQRTLLEMNFQPVTYVPANVFHEVERLDAIKMARLLVPFDLGTTHLSDELQPIADTVIRNFESNDVLPRIAQAARQVPIFIGLNDEQRTRLIAASDARSFQPGEEIFHEGSKGGTMHLVLQGEVALSVGDRENVAVIIAGQCLGETSLVHTGVATPPHSATATAKTVVETAAFASEDFAELTRRRPDIGVVIFRNLAADISAKLKDATYH